MVSGWIAPEQVSGTFVPASAALPTAARRFVDDAAAIGLVVDVDLSAVTEWPAADAAFVGVGAGRADAYAVPPVTARAQMTATRPVSTWWIRGRTADDGNDMPISPDEVPGAGRSRRTVVGERTLAVRVPRCPTRN